MRKHLNCRLLEIVLLVVGAAELSAHEMRPAFLELREGESYSWEMTWKVPARGPDMRLALDVRLPEDCQWTTMPAREFTGEAFIDRGAFTRPGGLDGQEIYIEGLLATFTDALVRIERSKAERVQRLHPCANAIGGPRMAIRPERSVEQRFDHVGFDR